MVPVYTLFFLHFFFSQFLLGRRQQLEKRIKELEETPVSKPQ